MLLSNSLLAQANTQAAGGGLLSLMLPLIIVLVMMYFMSIRPQKKREQELRNQLDAMKVGDEVVTIGGIVGRVFNIQQDEVTIATSVQNTLMTFRKTAINRVVTKNDRKTTAKTAEQASSQESGAEENKKKFWQKKDNDEE